MSSSRCTLTRGAPVVHHGYCVVSAGGCCLGTHGNMQQELWLGTVSVLYKRAGDCEAWGGIGPYDDHPEGSMHSKDVDWEFGGNNSRIESFHPQAIYCSLFDTNIQCKAKTFKAGLNQISLTHIACDESEYETITKPRMILFVTEKSCDETHARIAVFIMERSPTAPDSKYYTFILQLLWNIEWF